MLETVKYAMIRPFINQNHITRFGKLSIALVFALLFAVVAYLDGPR